MNIYIDVVKVVTVDIFTVGVFISGHETSYYYQSLVETLSAVVICQCHSFYTIAASITPFFPTIVSLEPGNIVCISYTSKLEWKQYGDE